MSYQLTILLFLVSFLSSLSGVSQNPGIKNYTSETGLPTNETYDVHQDSKGFVWIATDNGVVRFDGLTFETFNIKAGLEDPVVFEIIEDRHGTIWFRTFSGKLFYYANGKISSWRMNQKTESRIKKTMVTSFAIDSLDNIWLGTGLGKLMKIDSTRVMILDSVDHNMTTLLKEVNSKIITVGSGVYASDIRFGQKKFVVAFGEEVKSNLRLAIKWNNKIYLTINNSVFEFDGATSRRVFDAPSGIINISVDRENHLWIGYIHQGAQRFDDSSFEKSWKPPIAKDASVTSVFQDREGGFWITTLEKGIYYLPQLNISNYPIESKIKNLINTTRGLLISTYSDNMIEIDTLNKFSVVKLPFNAPPYSAIFQDSNQNFWIEGYGTFITDKNFKFIKRIVTPGANSVAIFEKDEKIYILNNYALFTFKGIDFEKMSNGRRDIYRSIIKMDSLFLIAGRLGLTVFNEKLIEKRKISLFNNIKIACQEQLNDSIIAIGTLGYGIYLYNKNSDTALQFNSTQKFRADNVYSVLYSDSILWMGTEKGVARASLESLLTNNPTVQWITSSNGLISNKINQLAVMNSALWAFSDEGASRIPLNKFSFDNAKPIRFYIRELLINGFSRPQASTINLTYIENNIKIKFGFISLQNQDIKIRYKLQENENWQYTTERLFEFSSLSPGNYQLNLQYSIDNFTWITVEATDLLHFKISPPWWKTFFFQIVLFVFAWILILLFFRNRIRYYQQRNKLMTLTNEHQQQLINAEISTLERERGRIAKELHDSVGTDLSALKLILSHELQGKNSKDIEDHLQNTIHEIKSIIYGLTPPGLERFGLFTVLKNYVEKLNPIGIKIHFDSYGTEIKDFNTAITIFRVIQELISNSLKHSSAQNITLSINSFSDLISIVYEDNGVGFAYDSVNRGLGLQNIESRIKLMHGQIAFESGDFGICYTIDIPTTLSIAKN